MDVFHLESSSISSTIVHPKTTIIDEITEVKFETHSEFDLNFFDTPDDSMTQATFSNPNSAESSASPTPEPLVSTAMSILAQQSITSIANINHRQQSQNMPSVNVKNGKATDCNWTFFSLKMKRLENGVYEFTFYAT